MIAVWFSCGAASAVAAKLTVDKYGSTEEVRVIYNPVYDEHSDNLRFKTDVEKWIGQKVEIAINPKYPSCRINDVFKKRKYISGNKGAPCTGELKKRARQHWEKTNTARMHVLGFTSEEKGRHDKFTLTERDNVLPVLIDAGMNKQDCMNMITAAGIDPPAIYKMGFPNANCIGCVKASSPTYWNLVRRTFPDIFEDRAKLSREIGCRLVRVKGKRLFLDELDPNARGHKLKNMVIDCGIFCEEREIEMEEDAPNS